VFRALWDIAVTALPAKNPDIICIELFREPKAEIHSIFETNQLESIFQLIRAGFGITLVPAMASAHGAGCALIPLKGSHTRRVGYLRARRHVVTRPMRELTSWLRKLSGGHSAERLPAASTNGRNEG
jgi:DNA-binding transcriptional LysR family regulator